MTTAPAQSRHPRWWRWVIAALGIALLPVAWYLLSPLWITVKVNENAPNVSSLAAVRSGVFHNVIHNSSGTAALYRQQDGSYLLRLTKFEVLNGPDLHVFVSSARNAGQADVTEENSLNLGRLKGNVGDQNYVIPKGAMLEKLNSVVIWCRRFHVNFATAPLE
jgi:Electron transfer DM13